MAMTLASCGGATYEETRSNNSAAAKTERNSEKSTPDAKQTEQPTPQKPTSLSDRWTAGQVVSQAEIDITGIDNCFTSTEIPDAIFAKMQGKSWPDNCTLRRSDLRYLRLLHCNADGKPQMGELVVNQKIADKVVKIFRELYDSQYRIEKMHLIDDYDGDDDASMADNNTSSFNFRFVPGTKNISKHSYGLAIDINPLYNPYIPIRNGKPHVMPPNGEPYAFNRDTAQFPYKITRDDLACQLFRKAGFNWGGSWPKSKDYQHFQWME